MKEFYHCSHSDNLEVGFDVHMKDERSPYLSTKPLMEYVFEIVRLKDFQTNLRGSHLILDV